MKRILAVALAGIALSVFEPHAAVAFGTKDVVAMSGDGIPDSLIIEKIHRSDAVFHLDAKDLHALKSAGVSDDVVMAMLRTESDDHPAVVYDDPWWPYPYAAPWYVGFDYGFIGHPYHRYAPGYRSWRGDAGGGHGRGGFGGHRR